MRYDFASYQMVTLSRTAVRLCVSTCAHLAHHPDVPDDVAFAADNGLREALARYAHAEACHDPTCEAHEQPPYREAVAGWLTKVAHRSTGEVAEEILRAHPTMVGFYAVLVLYDVAGEFAENAFEVLAEEAPVHLAGFSPGLPLDSPIDAGPWWRGARGFG